MTAGIVVAAVLAGAAVVAPGGRLRAGAMLAAVALAPVLLVAHIWDTEQLAPLRDRPAFAAVLAVAGLAVVGVLALVFARRPEALVLAAVGALPFRVPIAVGGSTANLLVPLYVVVAAGVVSYALPRLLARGAAAEAAERPGALEWALAATVVAYAAQATYSSDADKALETTVFFLVPFALLFALLSRVRWDSRLALRCLGVLVGLAVVFVAIGFVEYATRHLLLNPKVIASNQFESYFRVNSLFFDPNIYGRFLAAVMLGLAAVLVHARRGRDVAVTGGLLALLWAGLVLTFSQTSFAALLVGLAVLGAVRWDARRAAALALGVVALGAVLVLAAPSALRLDLGDSKSADAATSGRYELVEGGVELFEERPLTGHGSGAFEREYRAAEKASSERATSASHTIPVTVAAEQGAGGLALYLLVLALAFLRLGRGARGSVARAGVLAAFAALVVHTLAYAAFYEDPLTWVLLGAGTALARARRTA